MEENLRDCRLWVIAIAILIAFFVFAVWVDAPPLPGGAMDIREVRFSTTKFDSL